MRQNRPKYPSYYKSAFSITAVIPHLIFIAILIGGYYYIWKNNLFYNYLYHLYIGLKIVIACDIFIASISTLIAPILALIAGATMLYLTQDYTFSLYSNAWQLLIMSGVGFIIKFLIR